MFRKLLFTLLSALISVLALGQSGTDFWLAPPEVTSGHGTGHSISLRIATQANPATITISQPANAGFNSGAPIVITLAANSATSIDLTPETNNLETRPSNTVLNTGLNISSTQKITCYYEIGTQLNPDIYALKGDNGLGTEFYTPFQTKWANGAYTPAAYTSFDIVATQNNTTVLIYPRKPLDGGHPALTSYSIVLQKGQTYSGSVTGGVGLDNPAGTAIVSDKPIAVSVKDDSVNPTSEGCRDLNGDQLVPVNIVGTDYIVQKGGLTVPESAYITATQNNCIVTVAGVYVATLFAGETLEVPITAASTYINCSQPAYCYHISGFGCESGGALLPPLNCAGSDQVNFVRSTTEYFALNILVPAGSEGNFALNGNTSLIPASAFTLVPGTGGVWMAATIAFSTADIPINTNMLITNTSDAFAVGIINGGAGTGCRFGYFSEFAAKIEISAGVTQTVCTNDSATLNGSISGGSTTGIWSGGTGQFLPSATALNATYVPGPADISVGSVVLVLTSTGNCTPVTDQVQINFSPAPIVNAGVDVSVCENNPVIALNGTVTIASSGVWSGGAGTYSPNSTSLTTLYTPTAAEIASGTMVLTLTTTGNGSCNAEVDNLIVTFTPAPTVDAGVAQTVCENNAQVSLAGSRTLATGVIWSGAGTFSPTVNALNPTYTPTTAELLSGSTIIGIATTGNGNCSAVNDVVTITFSPSPTANANVDQSVCSNNSAVVLNGSTTVSTGGQWSGGLGIFLPNSNALNATYYPTNNEINSGILNLVLTTTGNGNCVSENDNMNVTFTPPPTVDAGLPQTVCSTTPATTLSGVVTVSGGGIWSGGTGSYSPNNTNLTTVYTPSAAEITAGFAKLYLTSTGNANCNAVVDSVIITITPTPTINAGVDQSVCYNNASVNLAGSLTIATGGVWSGGLGTFTPSTTDLNAVYVPTVAERNLGTVTLTLTSTGNGNCVPVTDNMTITITPSPVANASIDQSICSNNSAVTFNGSVVRATGGQWSGGLGIYLPNNNTLNAVYQPTNTEINSGGLNLVLTTTGNGNCLAVTDTMRVTFTPSPTVDAGLPQTVCSTTPATSLSGTITIAGGATWSGGTGSYSPSSTNLNTTYTPSVAEIAAGFVKLYLTTTGNANCNAVKDSVLITIVPTPTVNAGLDRTICYNNASVNLAGAITIATGGVWSGGAGTFTPSTTDLNAVYVPTLAERTAGTVTLTLTSTGNGSCIPVTDNMVVTITPAPIANASIDQTICSNNSAITFNGSVTGATGGQWSGGLGIYLPNNNTLNAVYQPTNTEINSGGLNLVLTTTGNGNCIAVTDTMRVTFTPSPTVDAGLPQTVCVTTPAVSLAGTITIAGGATWSGGLGTYSPSANSLNATYTPSIAEMTSGSVRLYLTTTGNGNCNAVKDSVTITIVPTPTVNAGLDRSICYNNASLSLAGTITIATGGVWSGGAGTFTPSSTDLNAVYVPTLAERTAGTVTLTLTSTGNGSCIPVSDNMVITITPAPTVNASSDQSICSNNAATSLNGSTTIATGGQWSGGFGSFIPNNNTLNAVYQPTNTEITSGSLNLVLTSTGNGTCIAVRDTMTITFTPTPTVDAGLPQTVCTTTPAAALAGTVTVSGGAIWSGGLGTYSPSNTNLNATYTPTAAEMTAGSVLLYLTSTANANCNAVKDSVLITIVPTPTVNAGPDRSICFNNASVNLAGGITIASGGVWSGGAGTFTPSNTDLNAVYVPTLAEMTAGTVTLTLTSTGNGSCIPVSDNMVITITASPTANANVDQIICTNNSAITLNGSVTIATGGQWSGGLGVYLPNNNTLNATYQPTITELANGTLNLVLTTTGIGTCIAVKDTMTVTFTPSPTVDAGLAQTVCSTLPTITLAGSVTVASGGVWTGGLGSYSPNAASLTANYTPSPAEIAAGFVKLYLTTTGNGNCLAVKDSVVFTITPAPTVNAGPNLTSCANNSPVNLAGSITNAAGGIWSGGGGNYVSSNTDLNAVYTPSNAELLAGTATLTLTTTGSGSCASVSDNMIINILPAPTADAGLPQSLCSNNANVVLFGSVTGASGGVWSGGLGSFSPSNNALNTTYTPTATELLNGSLTLTLTTSGNGTCTAVSDNVLITFTPAPTSDPGLPLTSCQNNPQVTLNGNVTVATGGFWTGGTGSFSPNNTTLNATYTPSSSEITNGSATLVLQTTGNANCNMVSNSVLITINPTPIVAAGIDQTICVNNLNVTLSGSVSGITNTGVWTTSGTGYFVPNTTALNANYVPSSADSTFGSVTITLTSTNGGSCLPVSDNMLVSILPAGISNAGPDKSVCANNSTVVLAGTVSGGATTGVWSSTGTGVFVPNTSALNANYIPSPADAAMGSVVLTLTANSCDANTDNLTVTITPAPVVQAGADITVCANNLTIPLSGSVSGGATTGIWTTTGTGLFTPNNTDLNATYVASSQDSMNQLVKIVLTSTNFGLCAPVTDTLVIKIFPTGTANAGSNLTVCANNNQVQLAGVIGGGATIGQWNSSGSGSFIPGINDMNAIYAPSAADVLLGGVNISLTATNSCNNASDVISVTFSPAPIVNAGNDTSICGTNAVINISGNVIGAVGGQWSTSGTGIFSPTIQSLNAIYNASAQDVANGGVWIYLTSIGNGTCNAVVDSMRLQITTGILVNAGVNQTVCSTSSFTVVQGTVSNGTTTGVWSTLGSGTFTPSATSLTTEYHFGAGDLVNGSVDLILTSTNNGSCVAETDTMTIFFGTTAFASAGNDFFMCASSPNTGPLNGYVSGGATLGQWSTLGTGSFANNTDFNTVYTPSVTDLANGSFKLILTSTDNGSCTAGRDTVLVTVERVPLANAGANLQACTTSDTIQLSGSLTNAAGGIWTTGGTGTFFPSDTVLNAQYVLSNSDLASGSIQLYFTTLGSFVCGSHKDSITVTLSDPLSISFANSSGCENSYMSFYDSTIINFGTITEWNWDFGDGGTSQSPNPIHLFVNSGAFDVKLTVKSNFGCEYSLIRTVLVQGSPIANFSLPVGNVIVGQSVVFTDMSVGGTSWNWTFGDGFGNSTIQSPAYTYLAEGQYSVLQRVTNSFGCSDTALLVITISPEITPYFPPVVPSGFSPNGDGENDVLYVRGGPFESVILRVYNNWGNLLFESDDVNVGWDGTHKGKDQPKGDYVYSAIVIGIDGKEYIKKGSISIIR